MQTAAKKSVSQIFREYGGTLRTSEAIRLGIHPRTLYGLRDRGDITQLSRGVYRLAELPPLENSDLFAAAKRVPNGVICLISALAFHNITTEIPHEVYLAVPKGDKTPKLDFPPVRVFHFSHDTYAAGIEQHRMESIPIKIYSREKSVADCFKFRNRIGLDVAIEALRLCIESGAVRGKIIEMARICRVENVIRPYLEAIQ